MMYWYGTTILWRGFKLLMYCVIIDNGTTQWAGLTLVPKGGLSYLNSSKSLYCTITTFSPNRAFKVG